MNKSNYLVGKIGVVFPVSLTLLLAACTVYDNSPPSASVTYVETPSDNEDSAYVEIRSENDFYEPLSSYGRWEEVGSDGRCWIPGRVDREWRPYSSGHWRRTDAGWYWDSDEPWGWATYHYGRWDRSEQFGWYWVPQTQWAPSWVSWHEGGGYVGWAPMRPSGRSRRDVSIDVNVGRESPSQAYVFVQEREFLQPVRPANVIVNNTTIINQTTNITNIKVVNKTVINEGPRTEVIERATGQKIQTVPAHTVRREQEAAVAAPHQPPKSSSAEKKTRPAPNSPPVHNARPAPVPATSPVPSAAPVAPPVPARESRHVEEPKPVNPPTSDGEKQIRRDKKPDGESNKENTAPAAAVQTKPVEEARPQVEKPKKPVEEKQPRVEKPKRPAPKQQTHAKESPEQSKRDAEKHEAEKRAKEKEQEAADQPGKSEPPK